MNCGWNDNLITTFFSASRKCLLIGPSLNGVREPVEIKRITTKVISSNITNLNFTHTHIVEIQEILNCNIEVLDIVNLK